MPTQAPPSVSLQGIVVPQSSINPEAFFKLTRRLNVRQRTGSYAGLGGSDNISMLETGILAGITVKFSGVLTTTKGAGTVASTARWPYDLLKAARFAANGQSNLVNCGGWPLKAREFMTAQLTDRGISQGIAGASPGTTRTQGTLSMAAEAWGVGQTVTAIPDAAYPVELSWFVPVAMDQVTLVGAVFAQTSATDLNLTLDWANTSELFTLTSNATVALTGSYVIEAIVYSIPTANGQIVVPDLRLYHSLIQSRWTSLINGDNEIKLAGQGVGRQLMRVFWRNFSFTAPLPVTAQYYGPTSWRFGANDTPETYVDGQALRYSNERLFGVDLGGVEGFACFDFCSQWMLRDSIDEGAASELRLVVNIPNAVTLSSPFMEYVQETLVAGAAA
jgi:hypothetical protein